MEWGQECPEVIAGEGDDDRRIYNLRQKIRMATRHWNKRAGTDRPFKSKSMLVEVLIPVLEKLQIRLNLDLRDALLFTIAIVTSVRAKEVVNMTWKDVTILKGGVAIVIHIRPLKKTLGKRNPHTLARLDADLVNRYT